MMLLSVEDIHTYYGEAHILQGVSIRVGEGEVVTLIGRNGAGKTTTLLSIMGIARARRGAVRLAGEEITRLQTHEIVRRGIGWVPEERRVLPNLTVLENLLVAAPRHRGDSLFGALMGRRYWIADENRLVEEARGLLKRFGMSAKESDYAGMMSGGQKRLIEIMRALMLHPRCLLLDEPMSGVHPRVIEEIQHYLKALRAEGLTIVMVEHELHLVEQLCDSVFVMAQGKLIGSGTMASLRRQREIVDAYLVG